MSTLQQLLTLKQTNLNLIVDLLNTPNVDTKQLEAARDTQNFINYQLERYQRSDPSQRLPETPLACSVLPHTLFKVDKQDRSNFAALNGSAFTFTGINLERYKFEQQAAALFPKQILSVSLEDKFFQPGIRNKEELIFKPSQEQLNGITKPVLPEDLFKTPSRTYVPPQPAIQNIVPLKPEFKGDDLSRQAEFRVIPGLETEIEQNVKADLAKLSMELTREPSMEPISATPKGPFTPQAPVNEDAGENVYDNPYDDYEM